VESATGIFWGIPPCRKKTRSEVNKEKPAGAVLLGSWPALLTWRRRQKILLECGTLPQDYAPLHTRRVTASENLLPAPNLVSNLVFKSGTRERPENVSPSPVHVPILYKNTTVYSTFAFLIRDLLHSLKKLHSTTTHPSKNLLKFMQKEYNKQCFSKIWNEVSCPVKTYQQLQSW
jgi:hypothetical protein